jgi:DNA gyrase subunit A
VQPYSDIMMITTGGVLMRTNVEQIWEMERSTLGATLINFDKGHKLSGLRKTIESDEKEES